jgi:lambda family phage portal protein
MKSESKSSRFRKDFIRRLKARYDAAQTTIENEIHWSNADSPSVNASLTPEVRQKLRDRSRYEYANNSYYKGMMLTRNHYLISTGPHLRISFDNVSSEDEGFALAEQIQQRWDEWAERISLVEKLSTLLTATTVDGESFMIEMNDSRVVDGVQLDFRVYEAEQIQDPSRMNVIPQYIDGIYLDENGYPIAYNFLKYHPGDMYFGMTASAMNNWQMTLPADRVIHCYRVDRPGQSRGIPWITPALPMFAQFRRFTLATLTAAEAAANAAGVVYTDSAALTADDIDYPDDDVFNLVRGSFPVMPAGWKMEQINPEHPAATFDSFRRGILSEIARCLSMPLNIAAANSENFNYASGRLDHQMFERSIVVERSGIERKILNRIFAKWYDEALVLPGYLPPGITQMGLKPTWYWDGMPHVDPEKEANAAVTLWESGLLSDEDYWFNTLGVDPAKQYSKLRTQQIARESLGLPVPGTPTEPAMTGE